MEDSQIAALPPELAQEAQNLRRDWETRNRAIQERILAPGFGHPLRPAGSRSKFTIINVKLNNQTNQAQFSP